MPAYKQIQNLFQQQLSHLYDKEEINALLKIALSADKNYFSNSYQQISPFQEENLLVILNELIAGKPIQQILGRAHFYNLDFIVNEYVLIPRPETEELIYLIIKNHKNQNINILDIGTGSGCIPVALKKNLSLSKVSSLDISKEALEIARQNADLNNVEIEFFNDNALVLNTNHYPKFDVIVSNPPYIKLEEKTLMHKNVLDFEPHLALFVDDDKPLIFYDKIADFALTNLQPSGSLYFEINQNLAFETKELLNSKGFKVEIIKDINNNNRFIKANFLDETA